MHMRALPCLTVSTQNFPLLLINTKGEDDFGPDYFIF